MNKVPRIGVGVIVERDGLFLLGKRKGSHGEGVWSFPGGHLESFESCAERELEEETGLRAERFEFIASTNDIFVTEDKHYVTVFMRAIGVEGNPENREKEKCEGWKWFALDEFPKELFLPITNLKKRYPNLRYE